MSDGGITTETEVNQIAPEKSSVPTAGTQTEQVSGKEKPKLGERLKEWLNNLRERLHKNGSGEEIGGVMEQIAKPPLAVVKEEENNEVKVLIEELKEGEIDFTPVLAKSKDSIVITNQVIEHYFVESLTPDQSLRIHAQFVAEATDRVRGLIHNGSLDSLTSQEAL